MFSVAGLIMIVDDRIPNKVSISHYIKYYSDEIEEPIRVLWDIRQLMSTHMSTELKRGHRIVTEIRISEQPFDLDTWAESVIALGDF